MPAFDQYDHRAAQSTAGHPAVDAVAVTPSDSVDLVNMSRALWVGGAGNISVIMHSGATVTFSGIAAGTLLPIRVSRVRSTGTTATNILALQ
jgi:hypothetical protein